MPRTVHLERFMPVTFCDLLSAQAIHTTAEAVALVLAAMRACDDESVPRRRCYRLPDAAFILLNVDGRVTFSADLVAGTDAERVRDVSLLLRRLLGLDSERSAHQAEIPGALLLLMARALREIDLPAPSYADLRGQLIRFGSVDEAVLSFVYNRVSPVYLTNSTWSRRILPQRRALTALGAAAVAAILMAVVWMDRPATGPVQRPDFVTVQTAEVRVPISSPIALDLPRPNLTQARQPRAPISLRQLLTSAALGADVFSPSFAPHGQTLLFHSGRKRSALMRATFDGTGKPAVATVLRDGATNYHATVSPDGTWLAYDSDRDGSRAVYVAHADAREPRKISGDGYAAVPRWSPEGRRLAFLRAEGTRPRVWNVWVADVATRSLSRVSRHHVGQTWGASWFPDGHQIAYSVEDRLILANLNDGSTRVVQSPRRGQLIRTPAVSPDGHYVVFQVHRDGVWLFDVKGGAMRRLLSDAAAEEFAWSPDGRAIAFHTQRNGTWSVWQLQLDPTLVTG